MQGKSDMWHIGKTKILGMLSSRLWKTEVFMEYEYMAFALKAESNLTFEKSIPGTKLRESGQYTKIIEFSMARIFILHQKLNAIKTNPLPFCFLI